MNLTATVKGIFFGAIFGLVAAIVSKVAGPYSDKWELVNLLYVNSNLAVSVPGLIASLVNWHLFVAVSTIYGAVVGFLFAKFPKRFRLIVTLLLLAHLLVIVFADFFLFKSVKFPFRS